ARADSRATQQQSAPARAHPTERAGPSPTAPAHDHCAVLGRGAPAGPSALRFRREPRTPRRPTPPTVAAPKRQAPAPRPDRATAYHQRHTEAVAPRLPPTTGSGPLTRPGTGSAPPPHSARTPRQAHRAADSGDPQADRASARTTAEGPR